jgi:hypothetical protein
MRISQLVFVAVLISAASGLAARAQTPESALAAPGTSVPRLVQFAGVLKDAGARPVAGVASVTFAIYAEQDGGTALWSETQNVTADATGHYSVTLGNSTGGGIPEELFGTGQSRWLGVQIARQAEMPRVLLVSVPYALKAGDAETLGGLPASAFVTTQSLAATKAGLSTTNTTVIADTAPQAAQSSAQTTVNGVTPAVTLGGSGTTGYLPLWTSTSNLGSSGIFQASNGFIGIDTATPATGVDVANNMIVRGGFTMPPEGTATASTSYTSHSYYFQASAYNSSAKSAELQSFQWQAIPEGNNTATPSGFLNLRFAEGTASSVSTGFGIASNGILSFAPGQTFPGNSTTVNQVNLPNTTSSAVGVINLGGSSFVNDVGGVTNTFVGSSAGGAFHTTGTDNTATGGTALYSNNSGSQNVANGFNALYSNTTGSGNTAIGTYSLDDIVQGCCNTGVGTSAGRYTDPTDSYNTFLGYQTSVIVVNPGITNASAIGALAEVDESNAMVLGSINGVNNATASVNVGIGTTTPRYALDAYDNGSGAAVSGTSNTNGSNAVLGINNATTYGSNGGYFATNAFAGSGVVGVNNAGGQAGYFAGNVAITGNLSKGGGSFKIDDPIAPAEKYLSHSFVESPDMMNIYNGTVILNAHGQAVIELPAWFGALNRDYRYQLTAIGRSGPGLYVAEEVQENHFKIAGGKPGLKVSWQVTGIRQDAWANAHRIPTEEEKPPSEQGHYLHPELFGATDDKRISVGNSPSENPAPGVAQAASHRENKSRQPTSE